MKDHLKKTFSDSSRHVPSKEEDYVKTGGFSGRNKSIKTETRNLSWYTKQEWIFRDAEEDIHKPIDNNFQSYENQNETFFNRNNYHPRNKSIYRIINTTINKHKDPTKQLDLNNHYQNSTQNIKRTPVTVMEYNLRCLICESVYHFPQNCPEARNQDRFFSQENVLFQADYDHPTKFKNLVAESVNSAILDSRISNTVTGESWMNTYIKSLDDQDKAKILFRDSTNVYRFGDGETILATRNVDIPVVIGSKQFTLNTDVVPS